jgi:hypothetical protein
VDTTSTTTPGPSPLMTFPVDLEVTVASDSFATQWGFDPGACDLSYELAVMSGDDAVAAADSDERIHATGATILIDYRKAHQGRVGVLGGGFTTATVHLSVTVDPVRFAGIYGLDPRDALPDFLAAFLLGTHRARTNNGTVTPLRPTTGQECRCGDGVACRWVSTCVRCGGERTTTRTPTRTTKGSGYVEVTPEP